MNNAWDKLKKQWNENPLQMIIIGSMAAVSAAKLMDSYGSLQSRRAYARQIRMQERGL